MNYKKNSIKDLPWNETLLALYWSFIVHPGCVCTHRFTLYWSPIDDPSILSVCLHTVYWSTIDLMSSIDLLSSAFGWPSAGHIGSGTPCERSYWLEQMVHRWFVVWTSYYHNSVTDSTKNYYVELEFFYNKILEIKEQQECILVGCVPSAAVAGGGGVPSGVSAQGGVSPEGCLSGEYLPGGGDCLPGCLPGGGGLSALVHAGIHFPPKDVS